MTTELPVHGATVTVFDRFGDSRGYFNELYNDTKYTGQLETGPNVPVVASNWKQVSFSSSGKHALRGLHCSAYGKFITCVRGAFYDVIADFREDSPTFGRWCGIMLTEHNRKQACPPQAASQSPAPPAQAVGSTSPRGSGRSLLEASRASRLARHHTRPRSRPPSSLTCLECSSAVAGVCSRGLWPRLLHL